MDLYDELDIVTEIKRMRPRWLGHMERMLDNRNTKKFYSNKPEGIRLAGRPRMRWLDEVQQDLKQMGEREAGEEEPRIETNGGVF
jgi:heme oxygenase